MLSTLFSFQFAVILFILLFSAQAAIGRSSVGWRVAYGVLAVLTLLDLLVLFGAIHV